MAMQFLNKRKKTHTKWIVFLVLFVCIILLGFFSKPLHSFFVRVTHPVVQTATVMNDVTTSVKTLPLSKNKLTQEVAILKQENERLTGLLVDLQKEKSETTMWNSLFPAKPVVDFVRASIVSKPNQSPYDTFLLDAGQTNGVLAGAYIAVNEISLLGTIDTVSAHSSTGILFSSPNVQTHARLERSNYDVVLTGRGGGNMIVEVPREIDTALGDRVLYPTHHNAIIGVIRDITFDERNANKKLFITLPTNILTLDHVYVER
jgi:cell shape-determining protein MreC